MKKLIIASLLITVTTATTFAMNINPQKYEFNYKSGGVMEFWLDNIEINFNKNTIEKFIQIHPASLEKLKMFLSATNPHSKKLQELEKSLAILNHELIGLKNSPTPVDNPWEKDQLIWEIESKILDLEPQISSIQKIINEEGITWALRWRYPIDLMPDILLNPETPVGEYKLNYEICDNIALHYEWLPIPNIPVAE